MSGLARSNLYYMRAFATAWPDGRSCPTPRGTTSWRMVRCLWDKLSDRTKRDWYAGKSCRELMVAAGPGAPHYNQSARRLGRSAVQFWDRAGCRSLRKLRE